MSTRTISPSLRPLRFQPAAAPRSALAQIGDFLAEFREIVEQSQSGNPCTNAGGDQGVSAVGDQAFGSVGGKLEIMAEVGGHPLYAWTQRVPANSWYAPRVTPPQQEPHPIPKPTAPRIYLSSGVHGDEPAGPLALLELLAEGFFDDRAHWFICPALNPLGLARGTRENADGIDLNRDYRTLHSAEVRAHIAWLERQPPFDLRLCLHEDWESTGFYLYEHNTRDLPCPTSALLGAVRPHMPIEPAQIIDGRPVDEPGILRITINPQARDKWSEQLYLRENNYYDIGYTVETPSSLPLGTRIAAQKAFITAAIESTLKEFHSRNS